MNDPFDEFEFKPITDGLGFHKKKAEFKMDSNLDPILKSNGLDLIESESIDPLLPPLPRNSFSIETKSTAPESAPAVTAVEEILKTLQSNKRLDFDNSKEALKTPAKEVYQATTASGQAIFLDAMLVIAGSLMCLIALLIITRVDLIGSLSNANSNPMIYVATFAVFAMVNLVYMTFNRFIMGSTPGEWAFDQCVGKPEEQKEMKYGYLVALRSLLTIATGFIVLPIVSAILNKDIAGQITGARLFKKV